MTGSSPPVPPAGRPGLSIALNLMYLVEGGGGVARYMAELTGALVRCGHDVIAFHGPELPEGVRESPWADAVRWVPQPEHVTEGPPWHFLQMLQVQWRRQPRLARELGAQVLHGPAYIGPPRAAGIATVVTVPDLIYTRYPKLLDTRTRIGMHLSVRPSVRGADRVIAISQAGKDDIVATLGVPAGRVDVTALGATEPQGDVTPTPARELRAQHGLGDAPVVLCVAQKRPHKNLDGLLRAVGSLRDGAAVLVLLGVPTPYEAQLQALAAQLGVTDRVRFVGWVSEADLEGFYATASCCCLPSFEEGFGLPVIEAMVRGLPVACSGVGALGELAGQAAERFDPRDPAAIAGALDRLLADGARRATLVAAGHARAAEYTWDRCAAETVACYRKALVA